MVGGVLAVIREKLAGSEKGANLKATGRINRSGMRRLMRARSWEANRRRVPCDQAPRAGHRAKGLHPYRSSRCRKLSSGTLHDGKHTSDTSMFRHGLMCKTLVFIASTRRCKNPGTALKPWLPGGGSANLLRGFADRKTALRGNIGVAPPFTGSHLEWGQESSARSARSAMVGRLPFWLHQPAPARRPPAAQPPQRAQSLPWTDHRRVFFFGKSRPLGAMWQKYVILWYTSRLAARIAACWRYCAGLGNIRATPCSAKSQNAVLSRCYTKLASPNS